MISENLIPQPVPFSVSFFVPGTGCCQPLKRSRTPGTYQRGEGFSKIPGAFKITTC